MTEAPQSISDDRIKRAQKQIVELCQKAFDEGYNKGYTDGLEAGMRINKPMQKVTLA